jgi:sugar transferase (PEP-CTERM/EpsH1 system associated)
MNASATRAADPRPLIAHIVFRFDYGGMENGIVNLVNALPAGEFRHAIVALTEASDFRSRITRPDVTVHALGKKPGQDPAAYLRLYRLLRELRPAVVHTRNIGTLDCAFIAMLAGVPTRIHGEHGWDVHDPDGTNKKYRLMRRVLGRLVRRFITVSKDLERYLVDRVGIAESKVQRICNGVDVARFSPGAIAESARLPADRFPAGSVVIGSVTRFMEIKDPLNLVRAFIELRRRYANGGPDVRLLMIGGGPLRPAADELLKAAGQTNAAWLPDSREDVSDLLRQMHIFVLGSRREGISNTVLESMASGLPVVASNVGGNLELVLPGVTGDLVPPEDSAALAAAIDRYATDPGLRERHGAAARERVVREYSLARMMNDYAALYRTACVARGAELGAAV